MHADIKRAAGNRRGGDLVDLRFQSPRQGDTAGVDSHQPKQRHVAIVFDDLVRHAIESALDRLGIKYSLPGSGHIVPSGFARTGDARNNPGDGREKLWDRGRVPLAVIDEPCVVSFPYRPRRTDLKDIETSTVKTTRGPFSDSICASARLRDVSRSNREEHARNQCRVWLSRSQAIYVEEFLRARPETLCTKPSFEQVLLH